jgi:hypothetical protein
MASVNRVVIEQQVKQNTVARKLEQATYTAIICLYPHITPFEYSSTIKTKAYGVRFKLKKDRKEWAVQNALRILELRKDTKNLAIFHGTKKKDDIGDFISMMQAFKWWTLNQGNM